jgi:hypothetical protein
MNHSPIKSPESKNCWTVVERFPDNLCQDGGLPVMWLSLSGGEERRRKRTKRLMVSAQKICG